MPIPLPDTTVDDFVRIENKLPVETLEFDDVPNVEIGTSVVAAANVLSDFDAVAPSAMREPISLALTPILPPWMSGPVAGQVHGAWAARRLVQLVSLVARYRS